MTAYPTDGIDEARSATERVLETVMASMSSPPAQPADSFILHAPLELLARAELAPRLDAAAQVVLRDQMFLIGEEWADRVPHLSPPARPVGSGQLPALHGALRSGDPDVADAALVAAAARPPDEVIDQLATPLLPMLGAAGHGSILLDHVQRRRQLTPGMLLAGRALIRDVATHPDWRIRWIEYRSPVPPVGPSLVDALTAPPAAGDPGSDFIYPTMHLVDESGLALHLLDAATRGLSVPQARQTLLRIAAMSMLQDDPDHAPYGWTHCLTMPQATLGIAHRTAAPGPAIAVAATYVLGFRATQSVTPVDLRWTPPRPDRDAPFLESGADHAAATVWHEPGSPHRLVADVVAFAACHHDAHLAKYTAACLRAAAEDPGASRLFLAAAAYLAGWWHQRDTTIHADQAPTQEVEP